MYCRSWSRPPTAAGVGRSAFVAEFDIWDERQIAAAERIDAGLAEIDLVRLVFCDPHGLARSKTLTSTAFRSVLRNGMDFSPGPFLFDTGHALALDFVIGDTGVDEIAGAGGFVLVPDPLTFQVLPHSEPRTAWVIGDEFLREGTPHPLSARGVLRRVCARYAERGLVPIVGLEVEWYLTRRLGGPPGNAGNGFGTQGTAPSVEAINAGYQFNLDTYYDAASGVLNPLSMLLLDLGLPLRSLEHESGPGQIETTFDPMLALEAADAMLLFRTMVKQACARRGFHGTFMSLPRIDGFDPSGWHLHQSVLDASSGTNVFSPSGGDDAVSAACESYIDGQLERTGELCMLSVPTINGYHRLGAQFPLSPTTVGSSVEDRGALIRIVGDKGSTHIENRIGEPCANPYLAIGAQLSAGMDGLVHAGTHSRASEGPAPNLPQSLRVALDFFRDGRAVDLLGKPLASCLTKLKDSEIRRFDQWYAQQEDATGVTEWEHREYFETF